MPLCDCDAKNGLILPYRATPEELICQQETLDEILTVLALCTDTQRERFLRFGRIICVSIIRQKTAIA